MNSKIRIAMLIVLSYLLFAACTKKDEQAAEESRQDPATSAPVEVMERADVPNESEILKEEIMPGLDMKVLKAGDGQAAAAGNTVEVHYTGWLFDPEAEDGRGEKFDSSVDRGQTFQFPLGAGRVIKGWDQGVEGMLVGEVRELTIAPELGYGDRGAGAVIPPGATLVFEVELVGVN